MKSSELTIRFSGEIGIHNQTIILMVPDVLKPSSKEGNMDGWFAINFHNGGATEVRAYPAVGGGYPLRPEAKRA